MQNDDDDEEGMAMEDYRSAEGMAIEEGMDIEEVMAMEDYRPWGPWSVAERVSADRRWRMEAYFFIFDLVAYHATDSCILLKMFVADSAMWLVHRQTYREHIADLQSLMDLHIEEQMDEDLNRELAIQWEHDMLFRQPSESRSRSRTPRRDFASYGRDDFDFSDSD